MSDIKPVRVRFAPSPTGHMHLGSARTALYDYLLAKQSGGKFILRIEDTDRKRQVEGAEIEIMEGLHWLGINWDEGPDKEGEYGPYRQSERKDIYLKYAEKLVQDDKAYYCFCSPERLNGIREEQQKRKEPPHYDGFCRKLSLTDAQSRVESGEKHVIRFKSPKDGTTTVTDLIRGQITVENHTLDDSILVKSDGWALYHLAAMVDDHLMKISHVIRGSEWLPSFPLHALIIRAFGWEEPEWVHLSVFLKPSGKGKMSKREAADLIKDGYSIFVNELQALGYLPEAVNNWIALMGWSFDDHTEFFTMQDLIEKFNLKHLNPSPAAINFTKFDHFNGLHIRSLSINELAKRIKPFFLADGLIIEDEMLLKITPIIQERIATLDDSVSMAGFFFKSDVRPNPEDLIAKGLSSAQCIEIIQNAIHIISQESQISKDVIESKFREYVETSGYNAGQVFGVMRVAITGQKISPPLFESMEIIEKKKVLERLAYSINLLSEKGDGGMP
jgi:glutamyl-tRNA synthetase